MFDGLKPEVEALLNAAAADLPEAQADAGLLASMAEAVNSADAPVVSLDSRRKSGLGKLVTTKAAAFAGVLVLSGGFASAAAAGNLPGPAQDAASSVANAVGLDIPKSDDEGEAKEHPENHGKDVSGVAGDKSNDGEDNHGSVVCEVASDGKCKPNADEDNTDPGNSADNRKDGEHRNENSVKDTTTTTVDDGVEDDSGSDEDRGPASDQGKNRGQSGEHKPSDD